jgi:hypothetical protein
MDRHGSGGARSRAPGVPWCAAGRGSSRRRHGYRRSRAAPDPRRLPPRGSFACDAPAAPRGRAAAATCENTPGARHFPGVVLVDAVKSHQGIEQQESRAEPPSGLQEPRAVRIAVEPQHRRGDHVDIDSGEIETTMTGHSLNPLAHDRQRVLGQRDQHRTRLGHGVLAQARRAGGHRDRQIQPQPCPPEAGSSPFAPATTDWKFFSGVCQIGDATGECT